MNRELTAEREKFWNGWFKSVAKNEFGMRHVTCSIQNTIFNREEHIIRAVAKSQGFRMYAEIGRGDGGNKGFELGARK